MNVISLLFDPRLIYIWLLGSQHISGEEIVIAGNEHVSLRVFNTFSNNKF